MEVRILTPQVLNQYIPYIDIQQVVSFGSMSGLFNSYYNNQWSGYRIGNSHTSWINTSDPNKDNAIIKDISNNFIIIQVFDKDIIDIYDVVANFEVFGAYQSIRYIEDENRDSIYVDHIDSVFKR